MSQQRERPSGDDWWNRLYDGPLPDTGPGVTAAGDTLDDRFDSAADAVRHTAGDPSGRAAKDGPGDTAGDGPGDTDAEIGPDLDLDLDLDLETLAESGMTAQRAWWEQPKPPDVPPPATRAPAVQPPAVQLVAHDADPTALPPAHAERMDEIVADTVLDGARYGTYTLRAVSVRGDSARDLGEPRRDALLTVRFGEGTDALVLVAVARSARATGPRAAVDACHWMGGAVGRSHVRVSEDIRAGRRSDLKSGLHRLTDRGLGQLRARAAELGLEPHERTASLRCLLLSADPECRTRVFFGVGDGGFFRLRDGVWQDLDPPLTEPVAVTGEPVVGSGSPPAEPFRFRASVARRGDTLLLCGTGLAEPLRAGPFLADGPADGPPETSASQPANELSGGLAGELADRWSSIDPPGLTQYLSDTQLRVKGYADDRTAVGVWEA